ncbi:MAG TPA: hypothetical protein VER11_19915 [Polyangiaceae bacterium]|nr:hypothetical protein [Polyangiaceae bacterium]
MSDKAAADFMHDQLEALLASPALARTAARPGERDDQPVSTDEPTHERDTEPSIDVQLLRDALRAGLKQ